MMHNRHKLVTVIIGVVIALTSFARHTSFANSAIVRESRNLSNVSLIIEERFDNWKYRATRTDHEVILQIKIEDTSGTGLESFRNTNALLAESMLPQQSTLDVSIILSAPLPIDKLSELVAQYDVRVKATYSQVTTGSGEIGALYAIPKNEELIPTFVLEAALGGRTSETEGDSNSGVFDGVVMIEAQLPAGQYHILSGNPLVYLVDITPAFAKFHFIEKHRNEMQVQDQIMVSPYPIYWYLENH